MRKIYIYHTSSLCMELTYKQKQKIWYSMKTKEQRANLMKDGKCSKCGSVNQLELHHKDYSNLDNVCLLCKVCHSKERFGVPDGEKKLVVLTHKEMAIVYPLAKQVSNPRAKRGDFSKALRMIINEWASLKKDI